MVAARDEMGLDDQETLLTCYNPGCPDKKFIKSKNHDKACTYHPKMPFFHDGIKRWPCCKKSSCDFSTLLAYPGCIQGPHNPEKPAPVVQAPTEEEEEHERKERESQKQANELLKQVVPQIPASPLKGTSIEDFDVDPNEPMVKLAVNVLGSLKTALQKQSNNQVSSDANQGDQTAVPSQMECENFGCHLKKPVSEVSQELELIEDCLHHPMPPVFHEGIQYWGCCQKKHTDFEKMRNQPGCTYGRHKWSKGTKRAKCRYDHFDNPKLLTLNIYAKNADPASCTFEANGCKLNVNIVYGPEKLCFAKEFNLFSSIEPSKCAVSMGATKIELKLVKKASVPWKSVESQNTDP